MVYYLSLFKDAISHVCIDTNIIKVNIYNNNAEVLTYFL